MPIAPSAPAATEASRNLLARSVAPSCSPGFAPLIQTIELEMEATAGPFPRWDRSAEVRVRRAELAAEKPCSRPLGKLTLEATTQGWRFPEPGALSPSTSSIAQARVETPRRPFNGRPVTRLKPSGDALQLKERLLYLLQPPLEQLFGGKQVQLPFKPFPYQMDGIAYLMPRSAALLADEMGLGKTMQAIVAARLLFHAGLIRSALVVCPKPLVANWLRELRQWAEDIPVEVIGGDSSQRRLAWRASATPLKLVNYETLTRDAEVLEQPEVAFDLTILDEAQRIKNAGSKTAQAAKKIRRSRSWALSGTPIENRPDDLVSLFAFIEPKLIPPETPAKKLPELTEDHVLRRVKEDVLKDMPPKLVRDMHVELTPEQRESYKLAEEAGIVHLNELGDTVTIQHVFELVMRLKQICNFDPRTGQSAKLEQLHSDLAEIAASGRKAILFSQWVEPLRILAERLGEFGPLQFHGKVPQGERQSVLERFRSDESKHLLLMSYGSGSVGLNLQFANYVFLFDRWWNPAIEDQAINRAHRIGQQAPVFVTRFLTPNSIEGRIAEVLERKRAIFEELLGQGGKPKLSLSEEELFGLFNLAVRPKRAAASARSASQKSCTLEHRRISA